MKLALIQARLGSQRLPGKVLLDVCGKAMLQRVVDRVSACKLIDQVVVATSRHTRDDAIDQFCNAKGISVFRGSETDVLDRFYQACQAYDAEFVVRVTADCPLIDPCVADDVVRLIEGPGLKLDYACNFFPVRTFPRGLDVEVVARQTLDRLWSEARQPRHREHVTLAIYENAQRFRIGSVRHSSDQSRFRWTVDTDQDLQLIRSIYGVFGERVFSWQQIIEAYATHQHWFTINHSIHQKRVA